MTIASHTIEGDETLGHAKRRMLEHGLLHLPVLRAGKLVGVLSQRDLHLLERSGGVDLELASVTDAMSRSVYTSHPEDSLRDVASIMADQSCTCTVIVEGGAVLGVFTAADAVRHLAAALA